MTDPGRYGMSIRDGGWILVYGIAGRGEGHRFPRCACPAGEDCPRPGKHPFTPVHPRGAMDALSAEEAAAALVVWAPIGARLAAVLTPDERVLDADSVVGLSALWRAWPEVAEHSYAVARSVRGVHVWQRGDAVHARRWPTARFNAAERFRHGIDCKTAPGYVLWPDGAVRRWASVAAVEQMMRRTFPGTEPGEGSLPSWRPARGSGGLPPEVLLSGAPGEQLDSLCAMVRNAPEGTRNNRLNLAAWLTRQRGLVGDGGLPYETAAQRLRDAGMDAGLEPGECARTVRSGLGDG